MFFLKKKKMGVCPYWVGHEEALIVQKTAVKEYRRDIRGVAIECRWGSQKMMQGMKQSSKVSWEVVFPPFNFLYFRKPLDATSYILSRKCQAQWIRVQTIKRNAAWWVWSGWELVRGMSCPLWKDVKKRRAHSFRNGYGRRKNCLAV